MPNRPLRATCETHAPEGLRYLEFVFGIFNRETNIDEGSTFVGDDPNQIEGFLAALVHAQRA